MGTFHVNGIISAENTISAKNGFIGNLTGNADTSSAIFYPSIISTDADLDNFLEAKKFKVGQYHGFTPTGSHISSNAIVLSGGYTNDSWGFQLAIDDDPTYKIQLRHKGESNGWCNWKLIPMADGTNASGTWPINISGNAATATKATQDGDGAVISSTYLKLAGGTMTGTIVTPGNDSVVIKPAKNNYDQIGAADCKFWKIHASTFIGNLTGTASTASTLTESVLETVDATDAFLAENTFQVARVTAAATAINNDGMILSAGYSGGWGAQIWLDDGSGAASMRIRNRSGATAWNGWRKVWLEGDSVTGAVWNDYAEYREADTVEAGYVLIETGKDTLVKSNERLSHFAGISSDTWGFSQGETEKAKTPIAVAGRVLAYPYQNRNNYKPGDCVCAAPGGTVDIMAREEIIKYPDRIVGTVSCVPDYEDWGGGDRPPVKVNGRIWIKIK